MELYRSKVKKYYTMLLEGTYLLEALFGEEEDIKTKLRHYEPVRITTDLLKSKFQVYHEKLTESRFRLIQSTFELDRRYYRSLTDIKEKCTGYVKNILNEAFGLEVVTVTRGTQSCKQGSIISREAREIDGVWIKELILHYQSSNVKWNSLINRGLQPVYMFMDLGEEEDPLA